MEQVIEILRNARVFALTDCIFGRGDLITHSDYVAKTDMDLCSHCGKCIEHCIFDMRIWEDNHIKLNEKACYGCGLCIPTCPEKAIVMKLRGK